MNFTPRFIKHEPTRSDQNLPEINRANQEPIRSTPGINKNHARIHQEISCLLRLFIQGWDFSCILLHQPHNFCFYLLYGNQEVRQYAIFVKLCIRQVPFLSTCPGVLP